MSAVADASNFARRGAFILFEGIDRCGKTTQVALLNKHLGSVTGGKSEAIRFPDRTSHIGKVGV
jgi:dTMP kinase